MKATEYGGSDTVRTKGIQPPPHVPDAPEQLRLMYATDPADPASTPESVIAEE
jgi:hypothetical protein